MNSVNPTMHVAVYRGGETVQVGTVATPVPKDRHDVLVEITSCGIWGNVMVVPN
jgi:threonine dehydrogenase-like Zn-dependent dehydrogenase